jgi:hypothetical protein
VLSIDWDPVRIWNLETDQLARDVLEADDNLYKCLCVFLNSGLGDVDWVQGNCIRPGITQTYFSLLCTSLVQVILSDINTLQNNNIRNIPITGP